VTLDAEGAVRPREQGFTLVELLIAMTLFGILMVMLFMGFRIGIQSSDKVAQSIDKSSALPIVHDFLRTQLAAARPVLQDRPGKTIVWFDGRPDGVEFVGAPPDALSTGGLQRFLIELVKDRDGRQIVLRHSLYQGKQSDPKDPYSEPLVLLTDVDSLQISYFGTDTAARKPQWQNAWHDMAHLPSLIRLRITFADGRYVPDLDVAVRLTDDSGPEPAL
jgi:general secretion pathway protein J